MHPIFSLVAVVLVVSMSSDGCSGATIPVTDTVLVQSQSQPQQQSVQSPNIGGGMSKIVRRSPSAFELDSAASYGATTTYSYNGYMYPMVKYSSIYPSSYYYPNNYGYQMYGGSYYKNPYYNDYYYDLYW